MIGAQIAARPRGSSKWLVVVLMIALAIAAVGVGLYLGGVVKI
jgi:hypothetical protein